MNEQLQAAFDKKFKDTWFFEDVPLNHATPATTGRTITEADILKMPAVGDTVYTTSEIVAKDDNKPERGVIIIQMSMIDQNGDVLQTGEYHLVVAKKIFFEKQFEAAAAKAQQ